MEKLNDPGEIQQEPINTKNQKKYIRIIFLLAFFLLLLLILFIFAIIARNKVVDEKEKLQNINSELEKNNTELSTKISYLNKEKKDLEKTISEMMPAIEYFTKNFKNLGMDWLMLGDRFFDLSYAENKIIKNSFGKNGKNFIEEVGDVNNGLNYESNERNVYDLYIPLSAKENKHNYNRIILFIHGGAWVGGEKYQMNMFCLTYGSLGFITASMGYTLLVEKYKDYNMFRIMDEITAAIKAIKAKLVDLGFDGEKLEMAISGFSAGGHLCLIYPYAFRNDSVIPIKFIINLSGPVTLDGDYFIKLAKENDTLDDIYSSNIEEAKEQNRIAIINKDLDKQPPEIGQYSIIMFMNVFLGRKPTEDISEMFDLEKNVIKKSKKYYEIFNKTKYVLPLYKVDNTSIPTLCFYGGNDDIVGIGHFGPLYDKFTECGNKNIELVYSRYGMHNPYDFETQEGINKGRKMNSKILEYAEKYFTK